MKKTTTKPAAIFSKLPLSPVEIQAYIKTHGSGSQALVFPPVNDAGVGRCPIVQVYVSDNKKSITIRSNSFSFTTRQIVKHIKQALNPKKAA